ncbi:MAG TPA: Na+/H+ antiporter subunit E [Phycisphaeraceae bacterium]|nr:Na+/H+ antiporter subunit E [Phycisphaeraceae bacterium]
MIRLVFLNIALAVGWVFLAATFTPVSFIAGLVFGFMVTSIYATATGERGYGRHLWKILSFGAYFLKILIKANWQIAYEAATPRFNMTPRILRYPVGHMSDVEKTTLSNAITLTPGTLVVDIDDNGQNIYVHCMYAKDREEAIRELDDLANHLHEGVFS